MTDSFILIGVLGSLFQVAAFLLFCWWYQRLRKRQAQAAMATTIHTSIVTSTPQSYPQQLTAVPQGFYQGTQCPAYQPVPVLTQTMPYQGDPHTPPPTYQEATSPAYPVTPMPYSKAPFTPWQPSYPLQSPVHSPDQPSPLPQPSISPPQDFLSQPAYNPAYVPTSFTETILR